MKIAGSVLMLLGLLLLVLSFFWTKIMGATPNMSDEELAAFTQASSELHRVTGSSAPQDQQIFADSVAKIKEYNAATERHEKLLKSSKSIVWILGIVMALCGVGLQIWHNQRA